MKIICGLEGGASFSKVVLIREDGHVLSEVNDGPSTNYLLVGLEECQNRINSMITKAKELAHLEPDICLDALGLCMSGCEDAQQNEKFEQSFIDNFHRITRRCTVDSDTVGSILTATAKGGIVLIAGTGSNSLLYNPDDTTARCGGWGHLLGDYGSAYWVSQRAIKAVIEAEENYNPSKHSVKLVKQIIFSHFKITHAFGLLGPTYVNFNKTEFSGLCAKLAAAALNEKDSLCCDIFKEAGHDLAKHIVALLPNVQKELLEEKGGLFIVCVGSIFKSWKLLEKGFTSVLNDRVSEYTLLRLRKTSAIGAAFLAAKKADINLSIDFTKNYEVLWHYKASHINGSNGVNGTNGTNGVNGMNGMNGTNGMNGSNGLNGSNGQ